MEKIKGGDEAALVVPDGEGTAIGKAGDGETISPQPPSPMGAATTITTELDSDHKENSNNKAPMTEEELERRRKRKERHRQERERQRRRQKEAERMKSAMNYLEDPRKRLGRDYEQWQAGQVVHTPEAQQKLTILRRIDDGHAGVVFKVRDDEGNILALKVPRKESEKQFKKLHQEVAKNARMQSLGLQVADITEEGGDYLVKRWIDGLRGDHWFIQWNEKGRPLDDIAWRRLCEMFDMLAAKNIYVQNLKDLNMIWDGQKWVVIDVGYFKVGLTPQQALGRYYETFDGRWNKPRYNRGRFMFLCPTIAALRGHSHPQHYIKREVTRDYYKKKSKTSTGDSGSAEVPIPAPGFVAGADGRKAGGVGAIGGSNGVASEALNDIKRKQAEAAMAVLERAKNRKKKKKKQAAEAAEGEAKDDATTPASPSKDEKSEEEKKKDEKSEAKNKKRSTKEEDKDKEAKDKKDRENELKAKKDKEAKDKKEKKDKELKEKKEKDQRDKEQKEKEKKEKEQQKKKK